MTNKIYKSMMLFIVVCVALITSCFVGITYSSFLNEIKNELKDDVRYIAAGIESNGIDYFDSLTGTNRITWILDDGTVIYDSVRSSSTMENHLQREEIQLALQNGSGFATRNSSSVGEQYLYYAQQLNDGSILRVSVQVESITGMLLGLSVEIFFALVITLIVAYLAAKRLSLRIVTPINNIDPDNPQVVSCYKELTPLLVKLEQQKATIHTQMNALKQQSKEFNSITTNMNEGMILINASGAVLSTNRSALKLFGLEDVKLNESVYQFAHDALFVQTINDILSKGKGSCVLTRDDSYIQVLGSAVTSNKQITGATILCLDVTQKRMQEQLRAEFSANVSHELKTPLTSILGFSEIMKNGMVDAKDVPSIANDIYEQAKRLIRMVEDILHISKLDEQNFEAEMSEIHLNQLAQEVVQSLTAKANTKNISIALTGDSITYKGVYSILEEILFNLVDNAIKYGKENGHVWVNLSSSDNNVIISVKDDGCGISNANQKRIFERFYRVDKSHSQQVEGNGLGLSIVKHGVTYHHGKIEVKSTLKEGSEFIITLPIKYSEAQ